MKIVNGLKIDDDECGTEVLVICDGCESGYSPSINEVIASPSNTPNMHHDDLTQYCSECRELES